jgi:aromatic ring-cleaving dioxygenase
MRKSIKAIAAENPGVERRDLLLGGGLAAAAGLAAKPVRAAEPEAKLPPPARQPRTPVGGKSPWGYETASQPTPHPVSVRPGETPTPLKPRAYTDIKSYHAHIYFDEDNSEKAALLRRWVAERFEVELGDWNLTPRGPHVTPSFYFGFTNDLLHVILPWLQLNSLGLTILLHPNTDDPRADHLYYTAWINRSQPVNAYGMKKPAADEPPVELIYPNTKPHIPIETA